MKTNNQLNRSQKVTLLSRLMEGDSKPLSALKQKQGAPFAFVLDATQTLPADRINTMDGLPNDLITGIVLTSTYADGKPNKVEPMANMVRSEYERWREELQKGGIPVFGFLRTYKTEDLPQ